MAAERDLVGTNVQLANSLTRRLGLVFVRAKITPQQWSVLSALKNDRPTSAPPACGSPAASGRWWRRCRPAYEEWIAFLGAGSISERERHTLTRNVERRIEALGSR